MSLGPGSTIGPFKIQSLIGKGGMGEVFSAVDTRLDRKVALKLLPDDFAADAQRLQRFESEAKTLARLNHPNILSIFEVGGENGNPYLVSELLEGETLREKIRAGAIPQRRAAEYALQIAQGLAAAHAKGMIHRDLKPENIFVTKDGRVKILDFGLAKLAENLRCEFRNPQSTEAPTLLQSTLPGMVLGTVGYMSPEQVRGEPADHRSDIFAFGCVLYEMLTGTRAFQKETGVQTMNAILTQEPPRLADANPAISAGLDRIVQRCLEKQPDRRFQSSSDLAFGLEGITGFNSSTTVTSAGTVIRNPRVIPVVLAIGALSLLVLVYLIGRSQRPASQPASAWRGERLGGPPTAYGPAISPDGNEVAFRAMDDRLTQVAVMMVQSGEWKLLTTNRNRGLVDGLCWSRDGAEIYYDRLLGVPLGVFRVSKYGGEERLVVENAYHPEMLPDDSLLVTRVTTNRLRRLLRFKFGARLEPLNAIMPHGDPGPCFRAMPSGKEVVFFGWPTNKVTGPIGWWILDLQSGQNKELPESPPVRLGGWHNAPMAGDALNNSLLYIEAAGNAYRIMSVNPQSWATKRSVLTLTTYSSTLDVTRDGTLYLDQAERPTEILRVTPGQEVQRIALSGSFENAPVLPLPGNRFLLRSRIAGQYRLMVLSGGQQPKEFIQTTEQSRDPMALLGPDKLLCTVGSGSKWKITIVSVEDGRIIGQLPSIPADRSLSILAGSPDGKTVYYVASGSVWSMSVENGEALRIRDGTGVAPDPSGKYLYIHVTRAEGNSLIRLSLADGTEMPIRTKYPLSADPIASNAVHPDGRIAVSVSPVDSWFWPAAILNPATGEMELVPEREADMLTPGWDAEGNLVTTALFFRSSLWRFLPDN